MLVTHQLQYLQNVEHAVLLKNGKIEAQGPFQTLNGIDTELLPNEQYENEESDDSTQKKVCETLANIILFKFSHF